MSKKLLLADDSITIQKVIGITFANEDFDLTIVDNGEAALQKARDERPDLILADIFMPGKDGYELCTAVKQDSSLQGVPVLLLTGTFEPFDEEKARKAGADSWIAKPFESQALIGRVEELLASAPETPVAAAGPPAATPEASTATEPREVPPQQAPAATTTPTSDDWGDTFELEDEGEGADEAHWGAVSLDEEELGAPLPERPVAGEEEEFVFEEEPFVPWKENSFEAPPKSAAKEENDFSFEDASFDFGEEADEGVVLPGEGDESFGFDEEPLSLEGEAPVEAPEPEPEIFSSDIEEDEDFIFEEEELAPEPEADAHAVAEKSPEDDVLTLEDADILDEEELEPVSGASVGESQREEAGPPESAAGEAPLDEKAIWGETAAGLGEQTAEDDFSLIEEGPEWGEAEMEEVAPTAAAAPTAEAEEKVRALSEEELAEVVEKVAGEVIERLANTVLEKIAWEVVPDLAESLIRDEIRKIKEGAA